MLKSELKFKNLSKNLNQFLKEKNMTRSEFAVVINCGSSAVSKWILGQREPTFTYICRILDALDCTFEELIS